MRVKINSQLIKLILHELENLAHEYLKHKALILTEDDLKCHLFRRIYSILPDSSKTINDGITGHSLHSEVKFYDENSKLSLVPDLTIVSPEYISIFHSLDFQINHSSRKLLSLPSKNFEIGGNAIIIELKFCRKKYGISENEIQSFKSDISKILTLQEIVKQRSKNQDKLYGLMVVFNKTNLGKEKFDNLVKRYENVDDLYFFYGSGEVDFNSFDAKNYLNSSGL